MYQMQDKFNDLEDEVKEQRESLKQQQTQNNRTKTENNELQKINEKLQQKLVQLEHKLARRDKQIASLKEIIKEKDERVLTLQSDCDDLYQKFEQIMQNSDDFQQTSLQSARSSRRQSRSYELKVRRYSPTATPEPEVLDIFTNELNSDNMDDFVHMIEHKRTIQGYSWNSVSPSAFHANELCQLSSDFNINETEALNRPMDASHVSYMKQIKKHREEIKKLKSENQLLFVREIELGDELRRFQDEENEESNARDHDVDDVEALLLMKSTKGKLGFLDRLLSKCQCMPIDETNDYDEY